MRGLLRCLLLVALSLACASRDALGADLGYVAADPDAPAVTRDNLLASERFWPYQVELLRPFAPEAGAPLAAGSAGVLVRIENQGLARIDFGRDGRHRVPIARTDVVARANQVRLGELWKPVPNLVHAIGPRLVASEAGLPRAFDLASALDAPGFLSVFADPGAEEFAGIARALAPLRGRHGVITVLYPQGAHALPADTTERLRTLDWPVPFVLDAYAEGYTQSLLDEGAALPAVLLHTREGRALYQGPWRADTAAELAAALERAFGAAR
jgi:hypothetical protein